MSPVLAGCTTKYIDTGCEYSESCLSCYLPKCKYDYPNIEKLLRDIEIIKQYKEGKGRSELAELFGLSTRTIWRVLGKGGEYA